MDIYISDQLGACFAFAVLGCISGVVYDILRTVRYLITEGKGKTGKTVGFLTDLFFDLVYMLTLAAAVVVLTFCYSYGKLRFFCTVSFLISFLLYRVTLGKIYACTVGALILKLKFVVLRGISLALVPIKYILKCLRSFTHWVYASSLRRLIGKLRSARIESRFRKELEKLEADVIF